MCETCAPFLPTSFWVLPTLYLRIYLCGPVCVQIRSNCGWNISTGSMSFASDSTATHTSYDVYSAVRQGGSPGPSGATNANRLIRNGQRHPLCGGEYLDDCDLGPYGVGDVGDGSCQQHLNTEGCHYDGGKFLVSSSHIIAIQSVAKFKVNSISSTFNRYWMKRYGHRQFGALVLSGSTLLSVRTKRHMNQTCHETADT